MSDEERISRLEKLVAEPENTSLLMRQHNPLFTRGAGRNLIEISFDDSIDSSFPLECFFQMPSRTQAISTARVWVQSKPFRQYNSAAASGGGTSHSHTTTFSIQADTDSTTPGTGGSEAAHTHNPTAMGNQSATHTHSGGAAEAENHLHSQSATGAGSTHTHTGAAHSHSAGSGTYFYPIVGGTGVTTSAADTAHTHTITLTPGIFESAASGTISLFVADDGASYGSAILSGVSSITNQELKPQLTKTSGDKRIKITTTGLMRIQVLLLLDLRCAAVG